MKQQITSLSSTVLLALVLLFGLSFSITSAHEGEVHATTEETETHSAEIERLNKMVDLLKELLLLMSALRIQQGYAPVTVPAVEDHNEMDEHHDEHSDMESDEDATEHADEARLIIEIEPHNNQTHAHVRYVDKPEEMFFVTVDIDDEEGIVSAISSRTGLSQDSVREALKYMQ